MSLLTGMAQDRQNTSKTLEILLPRNLANKISIVAKIQRYCALTSLLLADLSVICQSLQIREHTGINLRITFPVANARYRIQI